MLQNSDAGAEEGDDFDGAKNLSYNANTKGKGKKGSAKYKRSMANMAGISGGQGMAYVEYNKKVGVPKESNSFFKKQRREEEKRRKAAKDLLN